LVGAIIRDKTESDPYQILSSIFTRKPDKNWADGYRLSSKHVPCLQPIKLDNESVLKGDDNDRFILKAQ
jgi:hypothetical protein